MTIVSAFEFSDEATYIHKYVDWVSMVEKSFVHPLVYIFLCL